MRPTGEARIRLKPEADQYIDIGSIALADSDLHGIIRQNVISILNASGGSVRSTSHISLLNYLERHKLMCSVPLSGRTLRRFIGAVISKMQQGVEIWFERSRCWLSERLIAARHVVRETHRKRRKKFDQRPYHGRPNRDRYRLDRVPCAIA